MSCKHSKLINGYISQNLDERLEQGLKKHFGECSECGEYLRFLKSLKSMPEYEPSRNITSSIVEQIDDLDISYSNSFASRHSKYSFHSIFIPAMVSVFILFVLYFTNTSASGKVRVSFKIPVSNASEVSLVGDFNNWNPEEGKLIKKGKVWAGALKVTPGRYQYMIVVDKDQWIPDPTAKEYIDDGYGNKNSLLDTTSL